MATDRTWIVGSAPDCDVRVDDQYASSRHARVTLRADGTYWIEDLGSTNGTRVTRAGGVLRVTVPMRVLPGDTITIGRSPITWRPDGD